MSKTMSRAFGCPQKYIQGAGELNNLPELLASYGTKPFVVLDGGVFEFIHPRLCEIFKAGNMEFECLSFVGESCRENIDEIKESAKASGCDIMIGMGAAVYRHCSLLPASLTWFASSFLPPFPQIPLLLAFPFSIQRRACMCVLKN